jgi:AraC-like DNA-binding protein
MREIVRANAWVGFRETVEELGGDADEILAAAHVDAPALADPDRYMPLRAFIDCQHIAAERLRRPDFGLQLGKRQDMSMLGVLAIAIGNAATTRESIEIAARFLHVHNPALTMSVGPVARTSRDFLDLHLELRRPDKSEQNAERMLLSIHNTLRHLIGEAYQPYAIWFPHAQISALPVYRRYFGIAPVFERPRMGISMERALLDRARAGAAPQLRQLAETYLKQVSPPMAKSFTIRVTNMVRALLRGGEASPEHTASALGIHARTLQRRLKSEGTSFEKIKDDVRRALAESLLVQPSVSLSHIASLLDYADSSAFSRSCRRWFGEAPSTVRRRLRAGKPAETVAPGSRGSRIRAFEARQMVKSRRA